MSGIPRKHRTPVALAPTTRILRSSLTGILLLATLSVPLLSGGRGRTSTFSQPTMLQTSGVNVALASNGSTVTASSTYSSSFPASSVIDGDRKGLNWGGGGGWNDGTNGVWPDWLEIDFPSSQTISEIDVFTLQTIIALRPTLP